MRDISIVLLAIALIICLLLLFRKNSAPGAVQHYNINIDSVDAVIDSPSYVLIYKKVPLDTKGARSSTNVALGTIQRQQALEYATEYRKMLDSLGWSDVKTGQTRLVEFDLGEIRDYMIKSGDLASRRDGKSIRMYFGRHSKDHPTSAYKLTAFFAPVTNQDTEYEKNGLHYFNIGKLCPVICPEDEGSIYRASNK